MLKWIELLKAVDAHQAGKFLEVEENVARSYIDAGLAKDGGDGPDVVILQRSIEVFRAELRGMVTATSDAVRDAALAVAKRPNVVEGGPLTATESEADKSKGVGDYFCNVVRSVTAGAAGDIQAAQAAHERLTKVYQVKRAMTESTGASLGYTTPVIYESMILKEAAEEQVFVSKARHIPLGARQTEWPALAQYAPPVAGQSSSFGGVAVYRKGENTQRTQSQAAAKKVVLTALDLTVMMRVSKDAIQDSSTALDSMLPALGGEAIGWRTDWECWQGSGTGQMLGIVNSPATILVTRNTAARIKYQDVFAMYVRMLPRAKKGARWFIHPFAMADVLGMVDGSGRLVYLPTPNGGGGGSVADASPGTLLGIPIEESEKMSPLGAPGDLALASMDRYLYGERSGLEVGMSEHFYYDTDELAIRLKLRNDGKPQQIAPIYLGDGSLSNQVSAFVVLN